MKCPVCKSRFECPSCSSCLQVSGWKAFWLVPLFAPFFLPLVAFVDGPGKALIVGACVLVIVYGISFGVFLSVKVCEVPAKHPPA